MKGGTVGYWIRQTSVSVWRPRRQQQEQKFPEWVYMVIGIGLVVFAIRGCVLDVERKPHSALEAPHVAIGK